MNPFDIVVIVLIVLSGLFAFARGFVKEALSVGTWVGASLAALYGLPYSRPIAERFLAKGSVVTDWAAGLAVFVLVLILLSILSSAISRRVKDSSLSALDRTLGFMFGLLRGVILACLLYVAMTSALQEASQPDWFKKAGTTRLLSEEKDMLCSVLPASMCGSIKNAATQTLKKVEQARDAAADSAIRALVQPGHSASKTDDPAGGKGYTREQKSDMDRLIQSTQ